MVLKLAGSLLVLFAGAALGFRRASRCAARPRQLRQLIGCVTSLKAQTSYAAAPLPEGLRACCAGAERAVSAFFCRAAAQLEARCTATPREAFDAALAAGGEALSLAAEDRALLLLLACNLGNTDRAEQRDYLTMVEKRLEILAREAAEARDRNCRMYRCLGICGGLFVVLLLI